MPFAVVGRVGPKKMAAQIHPVVSPQLEETLGEMGWRSAAYGRRGLFPNYYVISY